MPKQKNKLTPEEQRKRFESEVAARLADGDLSTAEADALLDKLVRRSATPPKSP